MKLAKEISNKKNIDTAISTFKPPIFWKDKETIKQQIIHRSCSNIENLIYKINNTELLIKQNSNSSVNILSDFIIEQTTVISN